MLLELLTAMIQMLEVRCAVGRLQTLQRTTVKNTAMMTTMTMTFLDDATRRQRHPRPKTLPFFTATALASASRPRSTDWPTCGTFRPTVAISPPIG